MVTSHTVGDAAENLLERRWFAANSAAGVLRAECEVLREVMELAEASWRRARAELVRLDALREALGEELAERDLVHERLPRPSVTRMAYSAA
jgi:hypothetical protein